VSENAKIASLKCTDYHYAGIDPNVNILLVFPVNEISRLFYFSRSLPIK
jgi:hypothetical protein